jgi:hypothetical protein
VFRAFEQVQQSFSDLPSMDESRFYGAMMDFDEVGTASTVKD